MLRRLRPQYRTLKHASRLCRPFASTTHHFPTLAPLSACLYLGPPVSFTILPDLAGTQVTHAADGPASCHFRTPHSPSQLWPGPPLKLSVLLVCHNRHHPTSLATTALDGFSSAEVPTDHPSHSHQRQASQSEPRRVMAFFSPLSSARCRLQRLDGPPGHRRLQRWLR